ncbi:MAG TPA: HNH endonuclease signature motif containing protein [Pyrinomonadaceae bacterium]|jgi:5-methylcytosine-specific restriction endonuclease McrA|nr:HNH endonuclease signature motif containing protein [Pyrinomonadaceae bacterium]
MPAESENPLFDTASVPKLSEAKRKILAILWSMEWVEGADIFRAVGQTYYDRRIRELRESGWQIETRGTKYKLTSRKKQTGNERVYPNAKQKREVFERDKGICQICGLADATIQYDHKIPLERFGATVVENLQLLCRACNVEKRGACRRCTLPSCDSCPYAYPELFVARLIIPLDREIAKQLQAESEETGTPDAVIAREIIAKHYRSD